VYFFFEEGEQRTESRQGPRVVRVGTHALNYKSGTTLWRRLSQHRGVAATGGGNHRGSIFRLIVGTALTGRDSSLAVPTWGNTADRPTRAGEVEHEQRASVVIGSMPFLWLSVDDAPAPDSLRGLVERNAIALLNNHQRPALDAASPNWLGRFCDRERVRTSGLWNQRHVDEHYDPGFLAVLARLVTQAEVQMVAPCCAFLLFLPQMWISNSPLISTGIPWGNSARPTADRACWPILGPSSS